MRESFNRRFWYEAGGYLYDVVDGESWRRPVVPAEPGAGDLADASGAGRVPMAVGARRGQRAAADAVRTPHARARPSRLSPKYYGDLRARDAAYHQGTVWPWLIGPYVDAWLRVHPEQVDTARANAGRISASPERGRHRLGQRDFRRRAAVHAARLHRAGLERRRGAASAEPID